MAIKINKALKGLPEMDTYNVVIRVEAFDRLSKSAYIKVRTYVSKEVWDEDPDNFLDQQLVHITDIPEMDIDVVLAGSYENIKKLSPYSEGEDV